MRDHAYAVVDLSAIEQNILAVQRRAGVPVMAVVKADAYGHGAVPVAKHLEDKCAFFGVSAMDEALELAKKYDSEEAAGFVNGIMGAFVAKELQA